MVACSCRKKCVSRKCLCYDDYLKCSDGYSSKDCYNAEDDNETELFYADSIRVTDEEINDKI